MKIDTLQGPIDLYFPLSVLLPAFFRQTGDPIPTLKKLDGYDDNLIRRYGPLILAAFAEVDLDPNNAEDIQQVILLAEMQNGEDQERLEKACGYYFNSKKMLDRHGVQTANKVSKLDPGLAVRLKLFGALKKQ